MGVLYSPGLDGIIDAITGIGDREPTEGGLAYRGYDIHKLVEQSSYEEVAFLLLYGRLPDTEEFERFCNELSKHRELPGGLTNALRSAAYGARPLDMLSTAIAFLGTADPEAQDLSREALLRKSIMTIAKLPTAIAASYRLTQGDEPINPMRQLTHTQNFLYMLSGYGPDEVAVSALDRMLILYAEHESDVSGFTARMKASSSADYYSAATASMGSLKGRLFGGADEHVMQKLLSIGAFDRAEEWVVDTLKKRRRIMGFGHSVYRHGDDRARIMKNISRELADKLGDPRWHLLCERIEELMLREKQMRHELAFYAGPILNILGIPAELGTAILAAGRIAGWSAHIIDQINNNRMIPRFEYQGPNGPNYQQDDNWLVIKKVSDA